MPVSRRWLGPIPRLTRRAWEDVAKELEQFLRKQFQAWSDGIPPGASTQLPTTIEGGDTGDIGTELAGWARADHEHPVIVEPPAGLANVAVEGTSTTLVRADHQHKRDVRVKEAGGDVGTRNALNFVDGDIEWTITDDSGDDEVDIEGTLGGDAATFSRGGVVISPNGAANYVVWRAPFACTVIAVKGYRVGGGSATINAQKNGSLTHLASNYTITVAGAWEDAGAVQNTGYVAGDSLEIMITGLSAPNPSQVAIQVDFQRA